VLAAESGRAGVDITNVIDHISVGNHSLASRQVVIIVV
jgi:hypothetical protein